MLIKKLHADSLTEASLTSILGSHLTLVYMRYVHWQQENDGVIKLVKLENEASVK